MIREETVFGPIFSRRLGSSLGINLLPVNGKICTFDCIYCECGWNRDGRGDSRLPKAAEVREALEAKLQQLVADGVPVDSITFSGDGESTINPDFPQIIDDTLALRDKYYPSAKVSVLSNATQVHRPEIFKALKKVDNPIMKIDAPTNELVEKINHPAPGYDVNRVVEALKQFHGDFILQTMFLKSKDFDSSSPEVLDGWMDIVRLLKPREVMAYTIDRPTPEEGLQKFTVEEMRTFLKPLIEEGFNLQIKG
ncbi:MAG: radical SAM protein [Bacteroidales bacterium]|nr:radical SAM protein [Bacteroidales bacterium]MBR3711185.1 radical SAM protein [Bacteroidales bacterium]